MNFDVVENLSDTEILNIYDDLIESNMISAANCKWYVVCNTEEDYPEYYVSFARCYSGFKCGTGRTYGIGDTGIYGICENFDEYARACWNPL